jgi:plasmid replication initiation protein
MRLFLGLFFYGYNEYYLTTLFSRFFSHSSLLMPPEKLSLVVKSNRLIEASYRLSLIEQQLILMAVVQARENQTGLFPNLPATIKVADFAKMYNLSLSSGSVYANIKEAVETLFERYVTVTDKHPDTGSERTGKIRWISEAWYTKEDATVQLVFSPSIIPYITRLEKEFTIYRLQKIGHLTSVYAVRIYELLLQYKGIGARSFEIATLRETLGFVDEYKLLGDFKKWVINVAVDQINAHTDIKVKYETRKTGRKITHLDFKIKEKNATTSSRPKLDRAHIEKNARPGETYEQARDRLAAQRDKPQQNLID